LFHSLIHLPLVQGGFDYSELEIIKSMVGRLEKEIAAHWQIWTHTDKGGRILPPNGRESR